MLQRQHVQSTALIVLTECLRPQSACKQGQRHMTIGICMQRSCNGNCVISGSDCQDQALHISLVSHRVYLACGASVQNCVTIELLLAPR